VSRVAGLPGLFENRAIRMACCLLANLAACVVGDVQPREVTERNRLRGIMAKVTE